MKKIIFVTVLLATIAFVWYGCKKEEEKEKFGRIHGIVTDADTLKFVEGVSVELGTASFSFFDNNGIPSGIRVLKRTVTGSDGRYEFREVDAGNSYYVKVTKNNYEEQYYPLTVESGKTAQGDILLKPIIVNNNTYVELSDAGIMIQAMDITSGAINKSTAETLCKNSTVGGYS
ncbi:MAG: carboxypeptidase-like regulatory domain-containing protein, partial [Bacteroidetes bacterium]|nr:carboxypeptidase-like regulatory domain-containing protein [Bacteroidota bacterium]